MKPIEETSQAREFTGQLVARPNVAITLSFEHKSLALTSRTETDLTTAAMNEAISRNQFAEPALAAARASVAESRSKAVRHAIAGCVAVAGFFAIHTTPEAATAIAALGAAIVGALVAPEAIEKIRKR